jgi:hypothetical protein
LGGAFTIRSFARTIGHGALGWCRRILRIPSNGWSGGFGIRRLRAVVSGAFTFRAIYWWYSNHWRDLWRFRLWVGTARAIAIRTSGDVGGLRACIAGDAFDFGTVGFEDFATAAIKGVSSAEAFDCAVGLAALLLAGFAEAVGDFGVECVFTLDTDIFEAITDASRAECGVPIGVDIGCGEAEVVAGNLRAEAERIAPRSAMVVHI